MEDLAARYNSNKPWHFQLQLPVRNSRVGGWLVGWVCGWLAGSIENKTNLSSSWAEIGTGNGA